jgi:hypothetical protein
MRITRGALLGLLGLTALMHCVEGMASIADPAGMMAGLKLTMTPDVEVPLTFLGIAMIVRGAIAGVALWWTIKGRAEGLFLAQFVAWTILLSAPVVYLKLHRVDFAIGDLVHGLLLFVPAMLVKNSLSPPR